MTTSMPGFATADRAALNFEARELLRAAVDAGQRPHRLALHVAPEGIRLLAAADLADEFSAAGVGRLARRIRTVLVPTGSVLVVVVGDDVGIVAVPVSRVLGDEP